MSSGAGFIWPVRVYYEDTDSGGVVYYANYLRFLERARTEWLRAAGFEQTHLQDDFDVIFMVRSVAIEYLRPAVFNDLLEVTVELKSCGRSRIDVLQRVRRRGAQGEEMTLVEAQVGLACVNCQSFKPVRIPEPVGVALRKT